MRELALAAGADAVGCAVGLGRACSSFGAADADGGATGCTGALATLAGAAGAADSDGAIDGAAAVAWLSAG